MQLKTGGKGKSFNDRELAGKVRTLALSQIFEILQEETTTENKPFKQALLLKMSSNLLPRLNELTGQDGAELKIGFDQIFKDRYVSARKTKEDSTESKEV